MQGARPRPIARRHLLTLKPCGTIVQIRYPKYYKAQIFKSYIV